MRRFCISISVLPKWCNWPIDWIKYQLISNDQAKFWRNKKSSTAKADKIKLENLYNQSKDIL